MLDCITNNNGKKLLIGSPRGLYSSTYLEGEALETNGQAGKRLVTSTGLGNDGQSGGRAVSIAGSELQSIGVGRLVGTGGSSSSKAALLGQRALNGLLRVSRKRQS